MRGGLSELSVAEIEARFLRDGGAVSPALLGRLRRDPRRGVQRVYASLQRRRERERNEARRLDALLAQESALWSRGVRCVAGVDEVGTGPLAGPVVAAAVVFEPGTRIEGMDDSKRVEPERRSALAEEIRERARGVGVGAAGVAEIDRLNVYHAALLAMRRAVEALPEAPGRVLVDARTIPGIGAPQDAFPKGDARIFCIAAASIVAKVHRDAWMERLDARYPGYGLARHKGYGTEAHQRAIRRLGPSPVHRMSFALPREARAAGSEAFYTLRARIADWDEEGLEEEGRAETQSELEAAIDASRDALSGSERERLRRMLRRRACR